MTIARTLLTASAAMAIPSAAAQPAPVAPPTLIVAIAVDQFSSDLFAQYRPHFTGGLKRLSQGIVFPAGYQSHAATETCPGHATILTGVRPARSGIVANNWIDLTIARPDKRIYCVEDPRVPGSTSANYTVSPLHLKVPPIGTLIKRRDPGTRVIAVAGKDRAAVTMGGGEADESWWYHRGAFASYAGRPVPAPVARANGALSRTIAGGLRAPTVPALCRAHASPVTITAGDKRATVGSGLPALKPGDASRFRARPDLDRATLDLASALVTERKLGRGQGTDVLAVSLSATDYVGHAYGTGGAEMCQQLLAIDTQLATFFQRLDATRVRYAVVLTADHGGHDLPERNVARAVPEARRVDSAIAPATLNARVTAALGLAGTYIAGDAPFGDVYIRRDIDPALRARIGDLATRMLIDSGLVARVLTRDQILATPRAKMPPDAWTIEERVAASFDPDRAGDLYVVLKSRVTPITDGTDGYVATHGSAWDYDRRVPILWWWPGVAGYEQPNSVETVDIAPTIAAMVRLPVARDTFDGRCLPLPGVTCP